MSLGNQLLRWTPKRLLPVVKRIKASPVGYRLARGAFWSLGGVAISRGLVLVSSIILARMLDRVGYGKLGVIQSTVGMFGTFSGLGLGLTGTKYVAEFRLHSPIRAGRILVLSAVVAALTGTIASAILLLLAPWLASTTLASPELTGLLRSASPILLFSALVGAQAGALLGFEAFKTTARLNLVSGIINFSIMVTCAWTWGLTGAVWGLVCSQIVIWIIGSWLLRKEAKNAGVPLRLKGAWAEAKILHAFSLPAYLSSLLILPATWFCATILVRTPHGYDEMGCFNAANQWRLLILLVPNTIIGSALPIMSNLYGQQQFAALNKLLRTNLIINVSLAALVATGVSGLAPHIMAAYGPHFAERSSILIILAVVCVVDSFTNVFAFLLISTNRIGSHLTLFSFWAVALVTSSLILVPRMGGNGLALSYLVAQLIYAFVLGVFFLSKGMNQTRVINP